MAKMRILISLLLLFVCFPLTGCYSQSQMQSTAKDNEADPYAWDFGKVKEGEVVEHIFVLENKSDKVLNITGVNTSCGCTSSEVKDKSLSAGEKTQVIVKFNSKGYAPGKIIHQYIYVNTDDSNNPAVKFTVKIEIVK